MEGVEKNKIAMEKAKEKKRIELMMKENDEMSPIRNKFNVTQKFNQNYLIPTKLRNKSQGLFKVEVTPLRDEDKVGKLPPRPNRSGLRQSQGSFANRSHSRQIPSLGNTRQSFDPNASQRHSSYFRRSQERSIEVTPQKAREREEIEIQNTISELDAKQARNDELRERELKNKIENTHKLNELADNRMAQRLFREAMQSEMQY